jgi:hypothetical protein
MTTQTEYVTTTPLAVAAPAALLSSPCECEHGLDFDYRCCGNLVQGRCCLDPIIATHECTSCGGTGVRLLA